MKLSSIFLRIAAVVVFVAAAGVISLLVYSLVLRTDYKNTALEIDNTVMNNMGHTSVSDEDGTYDVPDTVADFYNRFLLDPGTVVYSRKSAGQTDQTITLVFQNEKLSFTGLEDGTIVQILWKTPEGEKNFRVRSLTNFRQLRAYWDNYKKQNNLS